MTHLSMRLGSYPLVYNPNIISKSFNLHHKILVHLLAWIKFGIRVEDPPSSSSSISFYFILILQKKSEKIQKKYFKESVKKEKKIKKIKKISANIFIGLTKMTHHHLQHQLAIISTTTTTTLSQHLNNNLSKIPSIFIYNYNIINFKWIRFNSCKPMSKTDPLSVF